MIRNLSDIYIKGDCMNFIHKYPDNHFDWAIPDPEYGIGESNKNHKSRNTPIKQKNGTKLKAPNPTYLQKNWDNKPPPKEYFDEIIRISKNQIIWGVNYFDYNFGPGRIIWDKLNGNNDFSDCEIAYCSLHNSTRRFYYMWAGMMQGVYCGVDVTKAFIQQGNKALNEKRIHPTQKPLKIYDYLIEQYIKPNETVIDTHVGSGNSLISCINKGISIIGYEKDSDNYNNSYKRIIQLTQQLSLF